MNKENQYDIVIESGTKSSGMNLKETFKYKDLIFLLVKRDFVSLYKQTILGPAWAIIQPLLTTLVFSVIFGNIAGLSADGVPTFLFYMSATILWTYFSSCLTTTSNTFISNSGILGKVYFPRLVVPISTVISKLIAFGIQFSMFVVMVVIYLFLNRGVNPNWYILMTPIIIVQLAMLSLGCGIIISSLTTKYRDLAMVVTFGVDLWKYVSPVAYDMFGMSVLAPGGKLYTLYMLNPITPVINMFRYAFLGIGGIDWFYYMVGWITTILIFVVGVLLFNKVERTFMDTI